MRLTAILFVPWARVKVGYTHFVVREVNEDTTVETAASKNSYEGTS